MSAVGHSRRIPQSDWLAACPLRSVAHRSLSDADRKPMWQGMAVTDLYSLQAYGELIRAAGFTVCSIEDLTMDWGVILKQRLAMYMKLREEAREANTPAGHDSFMKVTCALSTW